MKQIKAFVFIFSFFIFAFNAWAVTPTLSLWQPVNGSTLKPSAWTTLAAGATNAASVTWYVNGVRYCEKTASPYNCGWQAPASSGTVLIKAVARSSDGVMVEKSISISVSTGTVAAPTIEIWQPKASPALSPSAWTTLAPGVTNASSVTWYVNGAPFCTKTASPFTCNWQAPAAQGTVLIKAVAKNTAGVTAEKSVSVTVGPGTTAPAPTVSLVSPANGSTFAPSLSTVLSATATNAASVTYFVNGTQLCVVTTSPYNCNWQTPTSSGSITIKVVAKNSAGVSAEQSATVNVAAPAPSSAPDLVSGVPYLYAISPVVGYQGKPMPVTFKYAGKGIALNLFIFVHFLDVNNKLHFQHEIYPSPGTSTWTGDVIFNRSINVPANLPKGNYKIVSGFYKNDPASWAKVPATPGAGVTAVYANAYQIGTLSVPNDPAPLPPTIGLTFPVNNMVLLNNAPVNLTAVSDKAVKIDFYVNGELLCSDTAAPFTCPYITPDTDSIVKIRATAVGSTNLSATSEISVKVAGSAPALQAPGAQVPVGYRLYFNDEFENRFNGALNPNHWDYYIDYVTNGEKQCYTDNRRENVRVEHRNTEGYTNGYLVLQLRKEQVPCKQDGGKPYQYTSGAVMTRKRNWGPHLVDMPHGRYEIRAKIPAGRGTWPALWLLGQSTLGGWPNSGEIDIMEVVGYEGARGLHRTHSTLHRNAGVGLWPNQWGSTGQSHVFDITTPISNDFHVWAMEWSPTTVTFYFDGKVVNKRIVVGDRIELHDSFIRGDFDWAGTALGWPFSRQTPGHQYRMILNLGWGGGWGGREGLDDTIFTKGDVEMLVDYVRVYVKN